MPRARNIKPAFFQNEVLGEMEPLCRLLFIGLWTIADKAGRLEDRPKRIHVSCLPYDQANVDAMLTVLESRGFIRRYEHDNTRVIQIVNWARHQMPHHKERESELPEYDEEKHGVTQAQAKHDPCLSQASLNEVACCPTDSLNLIPDSLNPNKTSMSGKPDDMPPDDTKPKNGALKQRAVSILDLLNEKTGRNFKPVDANLKPIIARLREYDESTVRAVTVRRWRAWKDDDTMREYLRPATLYNATKFAQYAGEVPPK